MKKYIMLFVLLVLPLVAFSQTAIRTEYASDRYYNKTTSTTGDTIWSKGTGSTSGYLVGISFNTVTASDTVQIKNGLGSVTKVIFTASPPVAPFFVPYECRVDTSLILVKNKTSDVTVIYRTDNR